jgi:predicted nucleic acid-binding Zn ribbon protein
MTLHQDCAVCGSVLIRKHTGRKPRFCSSRCRDRARKSRKSAFRGTILGVGSRRPRNAGNSCATSKACKPIFAGRGSAGWRFLWHQIIEIEVFASRDWRQVISRDGVRSDVAVLRPRALREARP